MIAPAAGPAALVFVHSPLVGPLTWQSVADRFAATGHPVAVPDLTAAVPGPAPYQPRIARTVAAAARTLPGPVVLVGHSGAGPLLPGIAYRSTTPIRALIYVDAGLPHPGRSWFQAAPAALVDHLRELTSVDGWLPPWHEWFPAAALAELLPDQRLRDRFTGELPRLPVGYFREPTDPRDWSGAAGYLLLSEAYQGEAGRAAEQGVPVVERRSDHLGVLTSPEAVTAGLRELLAQLGAASS